MAKKNTNTEATVEEVTAENDVPYSFQDGVEIPKISRRSEWDFLKDMKVNQSFVIKGDDAPVKARRAYQSATKTHGFKVSVRPVAGGIGIWRIA